MLLSDSVRDCKYKVPCCFWKYMCKLLYSLHSSYIFSCTSDLPPEICDAILVKNTEKIYLCNTFDRQPPRIRHPPSTTTSASEVLLPFLSTSTLLQTTTPAPTTTLPILSTVAPTTTVRPRLTTPASQTTKALVEQLIKQHARNSSVIKPEAINTVDHTVLIVVTVSVVLLLALIGYFVKTKYNVRKRPPPEDAVKEVTPANKLKENVRKVQAKRRPSSLRNLSVQEWKNLSNHIQSNHGP